MTGSDGKGWVGAASKHEKEEVSGLVNSRKSNGDPYTCIRTPMSEYAYLNTQKKPATATSTDTGEPKNYNLCGNGQ